MNSEKYKNPLPDNKSLCVFANNNLIFSSKGKWLHPLFDFEDFLKTNSQFSAQNGQVLSAHDTVIGKAAVFLIILNGITKIHANLASQLAVDYIDYINKKGAKVTFTYDTLVDKIKCKTEDELEFLFTQEEILPLLRARQEKSRLL